MFIVLEVPPWTMDTIARKCDITQPILTFAKRVAVDLEMLMMAFN